jgi:hypothetical protein
MPAYIDPTVTDQPKDALSIALQLNLNLLTLTAEKVAPAPPLEKPYSFKVATNGSLVAGLLLVLGHLGYASLALAQTQPQCLGAVIRHQSTAVCLSLTEKSEPIVRLLGTNISITAIKGGTAIAAGDSIRVTTQNGSSRGYGDQNVIAVVSPLTQSVLAIKAVKTHLYGTK